MRNSSHSVYNKKNTQKTICVLPWLHLCILATGKVLPCCVNRDYNAVPLDLNKQNIEEIWNSDFMKSLRKTMIEGKVPSVCSYCFETERISGSSFRTLNNGYFESRLKEIPFITKSDGSVDKMELRLWDVRFSNICNNKCRFCCPENSSAWIPDAKKLGILSETVPEKPVRIESISPYTNTDFIRKNINTVERINFVGGEPLLMDEHWQIMEMLDESKRYDVNISYNTNLSVLGYKNKNAADYWPKWGQHICLCPSLDEIDERAELIRSGTVWKNVEMNLKAVNEFGIIVQPIISISSMNVFRIPEILDRFIELGVIRQENNYQNFYFIIVESPSIFHVSILPDKVRKSTYKMLENYLSDFEQKYGVSIRDHFLFLLMNLKKPWSKKNALAFREFTNTMDKIRREKTLEIIPELECVLNSKLD